MSAQELFSFQKAETRESRNDLRLRTRSHTVDSIRWTRKDLTASKAAVATMPRLALGRTLPNLAIA